MLDSLDDLVLRLKKGDIKAFESIYNQYHHRIFNFCSKLLPSTDDVNEAVQKVFISLWEQREQIDPAKSFTAYIFSIARYTSYNEFKQLTYKASAYEYVVNAEHSLAEVTKDELLFNELSDILNKLIEQLPPQRKLIFRLNRFYQLTYKAISQKLAISENTVDTQIRRALNFLRTEFSKY
jgi:RNA polymerase sigma-70 factor (ECF subfamily)